MINKENADNKQTPPPATKQDDGFVDTARMDVQCHILIRDKDTKNVLVNKRG